jgi:hypothetical protein
MRRREVRARRKRSRLDMLPLLDVFMVILFVFATIQERELGERAQEAAALDRELTAARSRLRASEVQSKEALTREASQATAAASAAAGALKRAEAGARQAEARLEQVRAKARRRMDQRAGGQDEARRQDVLSKLLDQFTVFEVEIAGQKTEGGVRNRCCFRNDPFATAWRSCGEIPATKEARARWLEQGGDGLESALRRTKGGNALTIIRQDAVATYQVGGKIESLLRARFPDHKIYDDGIALIKIACE